MKKAPNKRRWGDGRAALFAQLDSVKKWVEEGHSLRAYYDANKGSLPISYTQFTRHCRRYVAEQSTVLKSSRSVASVQKTPVSRASESGRSDGAKAVGAATGVGAPAGFKFDPKSKPENLI